MVFGDTSCKASSDDSLRFFRPHEFINVSQENVLTVMQQYINFFTVSTRDEMYRFDAASVMYMQAKGNYTEITTIDRRTITVCSSLSHIHSHLNECFSDSMFCFVRVGKSLVVNMAYVTQINIPNQYFILSDRRTFTTKLTAPKSSLRQLKGLISGENIQEES